MNDETELTWSDLTVEELDVTTLHDVLALRSAVFVVEQQCAYLDVDGLDLAPCTRHVVGRLDDQIIGYARILAPDGRHATPRIGRVIVSGNARGRRLGRSLMEQALAVCERHWPGGGAELGAQAHLTDFYASLGFETVGEPYDEDGILHVWMRLARP